MLRKDLLVSKSQPRAISTAQAFKLNKVISRLSLLFAKQAKKTLTQQHNLFMKKPQEIKVPLKLISQSSKKILVLIHSMNQ
jgi:hypothetical protein